MPGTIFYIAIVSIGMAALFAYIELWWGIPAFFGGLIIAGLARLGRILFVIQVRKTASYLEKHDVDCYVAHIYDFGNTITNYINNRSFRHPDIAYYKFAGETQKMYIYKIRSMPNNNDTALVFFDESNGMILGLQAACMPDLEAAFKNKKYINNHPPQKVMVNKWGDVIETEETKKKKGFKRK